MELYVCKSCHAVIEKIVHPEIQVWCCKKPMEKIEANSSDGAGEKHVPQTYYENGILNVTVGEVMHPMAKEHHIAFILVKAGNLQLRHDLKPEEKPEAVFSLGDYHGKAEVYEYCNLHGLWKKEIEV